MSYIDQSLGPAEKIVARAKVTRLFRVAECLAIFAALVLAVAAVAYFQNGTPSLLVVGLAVLIGAAAFVAIMIPVWTTEIAVTTQRLIVKRGLFTRTSEELQLWSIEQVDWEQSLLARLFGFGRLIVAGTGDDAMRLPLIANALEFRKAVQHAINEARQTGKDHAGVKPA